MTKREIAIMYEAFTVGRVYSQMGEVELPAVIIEKLLSKCALAANLVQLKTLKTTESPATVRSKLPVQQRKQYICPVCGHLVWLPEYANALYRCVMAQSCGWRGKRPAVA